MEYLCASEDCYNRHSESPLRGDVRYWVNECDDAELFKEYTGSLYGDKEFWLCDVCSDNFHYDVVARCFFCQVNMVNRWLVVDTRDYCSECIPTELVTEAIVTQLEPEVETEDEVILHREYIEDRELARLTQKNQCPKMWRPVLATLIGKVTEGRKHEKEVTRKRKRAMMETNWSELKRWIPQLGELNEKIAKRFKRCLGHFESAEEFAIAVLNDDQ